MVNGNRDGKWQQEQLTEEKVSLTAKNASWPASLTVHVGFPTVMVSATATAAI